MDRVRRLKLILWMVTGFAAAVGITRFWFGLGATTNLSDVYPWGFWIGFDVMGGVALAAGGFVITAVVYIFKREEFHAVVKPAVLTAFLGYVAVIIGLLFDLGLPWNIWHMMIYWNHHSPLFEVGWCVMLYTTVLLLEFSPVPLEAASSWAKVRAFLIKYRMVFVLLGISLSTLHQSSLGSLFLIMPHKLHPLWYTPILPILFFISAVTLGLMMVSWESLFTAHVYRRQPENHLVAKLLSAARWVILLYVVVRFADLAIEKKLGYLWQKDFHTVMFWIEILIMAIIPFVLASFRKIRYSNAGQWIIASLGVFGVVFNRTDVGGLTQMVQEGFRYVPSWMEFTISAGVVSVAGLVFLFMVEHFKVWENRPADPLADPKKLPEFDYASKTTLGSPAIAARTKYSFAFIAAMAIGFMLLPGSKVTSSGIAPVPAFKALGGDDLFIDGNRDGYGVKFPHSAHQKNNGEEKSCIKCHHMNLPGDKQSLCSSCHMDMYSPSDAFRHDWHASSEGANLACVTCHQKGALKSAESVAQDVKDCSRCHKDLFPEESPIRVEQFQAMGYADAMHTLCINCHLEKAKERAELAVADSSGNDLQLEHAQPYKDMTQCAACHTGELRKMTDFVQTQSRLGGLISKRVVLPPIEK